MTRAQWPDWDLQLFKNSGAQDTINAMMQAQQRAEQNLIANKNMAMGDLSSVLKAMPNPAGSGTIAGPTFNGPKSFGGGGVPGASLDKIPPPPKWLTGAGKKP